jgi:hypothetical protein
LRLREGERSRESAGIIKARLRLQEGDGLKERLGSPYSKVEVK